MSKVTSLSAALFLLAGISTSHASPLPLTVVGFDDMSCRAWAASKSDPDLRKTQVAWVRGVLTGHNYAHQSQQVSSVSSGTVENFVDRYCTEKPQGNFGDAAFRMSDRFSGRDQPITK